MDVPIDLETWIPLAFGLLAAFFYLRLLAHTHQVDRALVDLCRRAVALREKQEEMQKRIGTAPLLPRYRRFEQGIRALLAREEMKPPASNG